MVKLITVTKGLITMMGKRLHCNKHTCLRHFRVGEKIIKSGSTKGTYYCEDHFYTTVR